MDLQTTTMQIARAKWKMLDKKRTTLEKKGIEKPSIDLTAFEFNLLLNLLE